MAQLYNALQLSKGATVRTQSFGSMTQPVQFLLDKEKDDEWKAWNMDWLEKQGMEQIAKKFRRYSKNYKLANGIIDKTDYICEPENEMGDLMEILTKEDDSAMELKFYPIIPNVINVLTGEFSKRADKITYRAVDEFSQNELLEEKRMMVEQTLLAQAEQQMLQTIQQMGLQMESEQAQQMLAPENLKSLPQIEEYFRKDYRSVYESWASTQHEVDSERFKMDELERTGFRDMLTVDDVMFHFRMMEDDYEVELWNPMTTFSYKSPGQQYYSNGLFAGKIDLLTPADVIDNYGYMMTREQLESIQDVFPVKSMGYLMGGKYNDGAFYDPSKSKEWNQTGPSLGMRQHESFNDMFGRPGQQNKPYMDPVDAILAQSHDYTHFDNSSLCRVTTGYWKSQRLIGQLTWIDEEGFRQETFVDETFKITTRGVYDNSLYAGKTKHTLIYGQHVEWVWINQVFGGLKIGPNTHRPVEFENHNGLNPIYLNVKPLPFQFKGDFSLYGGKLPVEGARFSERNSAPSSMVDKMKPSQVGYNLANNQIADILVDELGTVILLDQNALPQKSLGEDWGKGNLGKAYMAMKDFKMMPLDTSITNTENGLNFQHYQVLNLEETNRLMGRVQMATYFKQQAFETIGLTPQRMGEVQSRETATGVQMAVNNSYAQTEMYFVNFSEHLMPRVHQMRTELAQYYQSRKPSIRLQHLTSNDERVFFQMNGTKLLGRELNVYQSSKISHKNLLENIKNLAINNNTSGATVYDLTDLMKADTLGEVEHAMKKAEQRAQAVRQQEQSNAENLEQMRITAEKEKQEAEQRFEALQNELDRENNIDVAEIRAAVSTGLADLDANGENDYMDTLKYLDDKRVKDETLQLNRQKEMNRMVTEDQKMNLKREELRSRERIADKQVRIASINKNRYDKPSTAKKK